MPNDLNVSNLNIVRSEAQTLFDGAIAASVTEANATVIDMAGFTKGTLEVTINSGAGTFSIAHLESEIETGVFKKAYGIDPLTLLPLAAPAIVTVTTESAVFKIDNVRSRYLKLVPTLTSTANATFKFRPCVL